MHSFQEFISGISAKAYYPIIRLIMIILQCIVTIQVPSSQPFDSSLDSTSTTPLFTKGIQIKIHHSFAYFQDHDSLHVVLDMKICIEFFYVLSLLQKLFFMIRYSSSIVSQIQAYILNSCFVICRSLLVR